MLAVGRRIVGTVTSEAAAELVVLPGFDVVHACGESGRHNFWSAVHGSSRWCVSVRRD